MHLQCIYITTPHHLHDTSHSSFLEGSHNSTHAHSLSVGAT